MAIFTPGPAIAAASGSVGGSTFSHNRGGPYIRRRAIPINKKSLSQLKIRACMAGSSSYWREIDTPSKLAWQTWAQMHPVMNALGNSVTLTGHQAFVSLNARLSIVGEDAITLPPLDAGPEALTDLALTADVGAGNIEAGFTPTPLGANTRLIIDAAVVDSEGITNVNSLYKRVLNAPAAQADPVDLATAIESVFGTLALGQVVFIRAHTLGALSGLISNPLTSSAAVTSTGP